MNPSSSHKALLLILDKIFFFIQDIFSSRSAELEKSRNTFYYACKLIANVACAIIGLIISITKFAESLPYWKYTACNMLVTCNF